MFRDTVSEDVSILQRAYLLSFELGMNISDKNTNLEFLFGLLRDATLRGEQGGCGGRDCYLWGEFSDCGGDHQFGHVGWNSGPDATRICLL